MNVNLNEFDVVVIEAVGDTTVTTAYKHYEDYRKDNECYAYAPIAPTQLDRKLFEQFRGDK